MSNPYESVLSSSRAPRQPENGTKLQQPQKDQRIGVPQKPLSQPTKRRIVEKPPNLRYTVRPRYRFDLPDPPMDPKMLLGKLSTASYSKPFLSDLERNFRTPVIPSDPSFALRANLVDTSMYATASQLNIEDSALLHSIMTGRKGGYLLNQSDAGRDGQKPSKNSSNPSTTDTAPWMRRMSYDEYIARDSAAPRQSLLSKDAAAKKRVQDKLSAPDLQQRRRKSLMQSFDTVRQPLRHPDRRKSALRPVSVSPILPDFASLGEELIALEFDKEDFLTFPSRATDDQEAAEQSIRSTATVSVAEPLVSGQERKYAVVYTPTGGTLTRRKRKREEADENQGNEVSKKIEFLEDETYQWMGEYSIREGKFGQTFTAGGLSRSCFAVTEYKPAQGSAGVACLTRIGTTWKLRTRAQADTPSRLGKDGLKISRDPNYAGGGDVVRRDVLSGKARL